MQHGEGPPHMPIRLLRESICTDLIIDSLTPEEEVCLYRLKTAADDYGCFLGDLDVIVGHCFAKKRKRLADDEVEGWLQGLAAKGAIGFYMADGLRYLKILVWDQKPRNKSCKYPLPPGSMGYPMPNGSADLPADQATGMPTPGANADDTEGPAATGMPTPGTDQALDWVKWYERKFAVCPSARDLASFDELQKTGVTDALIVECIQLALKDKARRPLGLARSMIADVVPYGVKTLADWVKHKADQQAPPGGGADPPPDETEQEDTITRRLRRQQEGHIAS